jgi:hypothetical protein
MAESPSWCGHPGARHWGAPGLPGRRRTLTVLQGHAELAERHKEEPSTIWQNPTFHPARQGRQIRQQNPSFEGPGRRRVFRAGAEWQLRRQPGAVSRRAVRRAPPCAPGASAGGGPKPTSGPPPRGPAPPPQPSPAPPASARRQQREPALGAPHGWRPRPASPSPPPPGPPCWPRPASGRRPAPGSRPLPGLRAPPSAPKPARPLRPGGRSAWGGRAGVTPARMGAPRPLPRKRGRRLQEAAGWSRVRELSGLASPPAS